MHMPPKKEHMVNYDIPFTKVFVINQNGEKLGVIETKKAIFLAENAGQDLVVIASKTRPPVVKIMNYGKFKYNRNKKQKEEKLKQTTISNREIRISTMIGIHDLKTKAQKSRTFLLKGDRVKVSLKFRGREIARQELGYKVLKEFYEFVSDIACIDKEPKLNASRFLDMYLIQDKAKISKLNNKGDNDAKDENKVFAKKEN